MLSPADDDTEGILLHLRDSTWNALAEIASHPCAEELRQYLRWKVQHSKAG